MKIYGAIIGKAYYTGAINLEEAVKVAKENVKDNDCTNIECDVADLLKGVKPLKYDVITANIVADIIIRMPLIPNINSSREDIKALADYLKAHKGQYRYAEIMQYHKLGNSKLESLGRSDELLPDIPTNEEFGRLWLDTFAEYGLDDVKISR